MHTICLNMIVKDESHIIKSTLENLVQNIKFDYYVICDTGSSDDTKDIISSFFDNLGIKGEIHDHKWKDFSHNRTIALRAAFGKTDYLMVFDADDMIVGNLDTSFLSNKCDAYSLKFGPGTIYYRTLIVNNRLKWKYTSILHEYIECEELCNSVDEISRDGYYIVSGRTGNRSKNPNKYRDDAAILLRGFISEMSCNGPLQSRYAFYCAQSFRDANMLLPAIKMYRKCLELFGWEQEKYMACVELGKLHLIIKNNEKAIHYFLKSKEYDPTRIDGIVAAMDTLRQMIRHSDVNKIYHENIAYEFPKESKLFIIPELYNHRIEYLNSISACYTCDKLSGYICCKKILTLKILVPNMYKQTLENLRFYEEFVVVDKHKSLLEESISSLKNMELSNESSIFYKKYFPNTSCL